MAAVLLGRLPDQIPIHFGMTGDVDSYGSRWFIFLAPGVIFFFQVMAEIFRRMDPKRKAYEEFAPHYYNLMFGISLLMLMLEVVTAAAAFDIPIYIPSLMMGAVGLLFLFMGNMLPKFRHNYFVGIRTSWTLADEDVWYLTHRLCAKVWMVCGTALAVAAFLPIYVGIVVFVIDILIMLGVPIAVSYFYYEKRHGAREREEVEAQDKMKEKPL